MKFETRQNPRKQRPRINEKKNNNNKEELKILICEFCFLRFVVVAFTVAVVVFIVVIVVCVQMFVEAINEKKIKKNERSLKF